MSKVLRLFLLSFLIVPFLMSFVYAGVLSVTEFTVSKEIAEKVKYKAGTGIGNKINSYTVGANAGNPFVEFSINAGTFTIPNLSDLQICKGLTKLNSAAPTLSADKKKLTFPLAGANLVNGEVITLKKKGVADCDTVLTAPDIEIKEIPQNTFSVTLGVRVLNILGNEVDSGSATIVNATQYEYSASIDTKLNALINFDPCTIGANTYPAFANLYTPPCSLKDDLKVSLIRATFDYHTNSPDFPPGTHDLTFTLEPAPTTGIVSIADVTAIPSWTCPPAFTFPLTCTQTNVVPAPGANSYDFEISVGGFTVLSETTFKATLNINYDGLPTYSRFLLQNADAGKWSYRGTSIKVPFIFVHTATGKNTFIILHSKVNSPSKVWALILASDGSIVTANLSDITPGQTYIIAGDTLASKVTAAGKTVGQRFAAIINVAATGADIFAYANVIEPDKVRFVPLEVN